MYEFFGYFLMHPNGYNHTFAGPGGTYLIHGRTNNFSCLNQVNIEHELTLKKGGNKSTLFKIDPYSKISWTAWFPTILHFWVGGNTGLYQTTTICADCFKLMKDRQ